MTKSKVYVLVIFSIVFGWVMSLPYEGPIMYVLADELGINGVHLNIFTVIFHFAGLFTSQWIIKDLASAKRHQSILIGMTMIISLLMLLTSWWHILIPIMALLTGWVIGSQGHFIKLTIPIEERTKFVAWVLVLGNIILIAASFFSMNASSYLAYGIIELLLFIAFILSMNLKLPDEVSEVKEKSFDKNFYILFVFMFVISINSGIMFQVIYPYFYEFELLVSLYTNVPYIIIILALTYFYKRNKFYFLYIGLLLWGLTFIIFSFMGPSPGSFLVICTLMLSACGIFDLFWWSIMANNLDQFKNPSSFFGVGLSVNVLGVWVGGNIGNLMMSSGLGFQDLSFFGLFIVLLSMILLLPLNNRLSGIIQQNDFLVEMTMVTETMIDRYLKDVKSKLSNREYEVFEHLISGETDSQIADALFVSLSTIKTHNRNIYKKLEVKSRVELIEKIKNQP